MEADLEAGGLFAQAGGEDDARVAIAWGEEFSAAIKAWQEQNES
jgi:hypothetical protein